MATQKVSVNEFKSILKEEIAGVAQSMSWNIDSTSGRGYAFQLWVAHLLCNYDRGFDTDPEEAILKSNDLKADLCLEDSNQKHLLIAQCKYLSLSKPPSVDETEVNDFFNRHERYKEANWVKKHGSEDAIEFLGDYSEKLKGGYTVDYYFISTGVATPRVKDLVENISENYKKNDLAINCYLIDLYELKDLYANTHSLDVLIPEKVQLDLPKDKWFRKEDPHDTIVAVIKGNSLRNLYKEHKEALFAYNIRGYLGKRGINTKIIETAHSKPASFFYFNNGVSAICTGFTIEDDCLSAENFQIINGAQTVGALNKAGDSSQIDVLFRLTKTGSVKTEKGMNIDIIRYNNSQNIIKTSDFHSNDPIQMWLERTFREKTPYGIIFKINYLRRRGGKKKQGQTLKFEELAKIRYSFLFEPTLVHAAPKELWTPESEHGVYEKAFGVGGHLQELWSIDEFNRCLLAIVFYFRIEKVCKDENRHRWALAGFPCHTTVRTGPYTAVRFS